MLAKKLYKSCINESALEEQGLMFMKEALRDIGGWPVVEGTDWKDRDYDWKEAIYTLREKGFDYNVLTAMYVGTDEVNPFRPILKVNYRDSRNLQH